jgi:hypothetical protein
MVLVYWIGCPKEPEPTPASELDCVSIAIAAAGGGPDPCDVAACTWCMDNLG